MLIKIDFAEFWLIIIISTYCGGSAILLSRDLSLTFSNGCDAQVHLWVCTSHLGYFARVLNKAMIERHLMRAKLTNGKGSKFARNPPSERCNLRPTACLLRHERSRFSVYPVQQKVGHSVRKIRSTIRLRQGWHQKRSHFFVPAATPDCSLIGQLSQAIDRIDRPGIAPGGSTDMELLVDPINMTVKAFRRGFSAEMTQFRCLHCSQRHMLFILDNDSARAVMQSLLINI